MIQMNLFMKQKQTHRLRQWTSVTSGEGWREGIVREFGIHTYTLLYLKWITSKALLSSTGKSARCCVAAWMGEEFGENGYMYMYGWILLLSTWNYHSIVNWLYSNIKLKALKKSWYPDLDVIFQLYFIILAFVNQNYINYKLHYSYKLYC